MTRSDYVALGDWGTTRLRLYLAQGDTIQDRCTGPGIGTLTVPPLEALRAALAPWRAAHGINRVVLCGMAGSRNGLREAPYLPLPAERLDWASHPLAFDAEGLAISIGPGLSRVDEGGTADVMRGEETQVFGALGIDRALRLGRHWLVLPGTHSKWVQLEDSSIVRFTTYITGELFGLLKDHSTLLRAGAMALAGEGIGDVQGIEGGEDVDADEGFTAGLQRSQQHAAGLAAAVFEARSARLIQGRSHGWATEFLSGLLIGSEIRAALEAAREPRYMTLIGDPRLTARYRRALTQYAIEAVELDGDRCVVAGLLLLANAALEDP
jgi:2-dehydro-3-deoxygalactonokinase